MSFTYTVTLPEEVREVLKKDFIELSRPDFDLEPCTSLMVMKPFVTLGDRVYFHGDFLFLVKRTEESPFGYTSSLGNWLVECPFTTSVWTNIENMVAEGVLAL